MQIEQDCRSKTKADSFNLELLKNIKSGQGNIHIHDIVNHQIFKVQCYEITFKGSYRSNNYSTC